MKDARISSNELSKSQKSLVAFPLCAQEQGGGSSPCSADEQRPLGTKLQSEKREGCTSTSGIIYREVDIPFWWQMKAAIAQILGGQTSREDISSFFFPSTSERFSFICWGLEITAPGKDRLWGLEDPIEEEGSCTSCLNLDFHVTMLRQEWAFWVGQEILSVTSLSLRCLILRVIPFALEEKDLDPLWRLQNTGWLTYISPSSWAILTPTACTQYQSLVCLSLCLETTSVSCCIKWPLWRLCHKTMLVAIYI